MNESTNLIVDTGPTSQFAHILKNLGIPILSIKEGNWDEFGEIKITTYLTVRVPVGIWGGNVGLVRVVDQTIIYSFRFCSTIEDFVVQIKQAIKDETLDLNRAKAFLIAPRS